MSRSTVWSEMRRILKILAGIFSSMSNARKAVLIMLVVILAFALITVVYTRPLALKSSDHVIGWAQDQYFNIYAISWNLHALTHNPLGLFDATIFYPNENTLAYSDHQLMNALLAAPAYAVTRSPVFSFNFALILSFIICALGAYLLVDHLTQNKLAAFAGGVIYGFSMYKLAHITQLQLLAAGFIPLALLCLHLYTERKKPLYAILFGLFVTGLFWTAWCYGFYILLTVLIYLAVLAFTKRKLIWAILRRRTGAEERKSALKWSAYLIAAFLMVLVLVGPFVVPYLQIQSKDPSFNRDIGIVKYYSADVQDFMLAPTSSRFWSSATSRFQADANRRGGAAERALFTGIMPLALALIGFIYLLKKREGNNWHALLFYSILLVVSVVMCLGPYLHVLGRETNIPMPYLLLYRYFPGFRSIRTPARIMVLAVVPLAVLGGFGVKWIFEAIKKRFGGRAAVPAALLLILLLVIEVMPFPFEATKIEKQADLPKPYHELARMEGDAPAIVLPLAAYDPSKYPAPSKVYTETYVALEPPRLYTNSVNWKKMLNGYSGFVSGTYIEAVKEMSGFPDDASVKFLDRLKIKYVIMEGSHYDPTAFSAILNKLIRDPRFRLNSVSDKCYMFEVIDKKQARPQDRKEG